MAKPDFKKLAEELKRFQHLIPTQVPGVMIDLPKFQNLVISKLHSEAGLDANTPLNLDPSTPEGQRNIEQVRARGTMFKRTLDSQTPAQQAQMITEWGGTGSDIFTSKDRRGEPLPGSPPQKTLDSMFTGTQRTLPAHVNAANHYLVNSAQSGRLINPEGAMPWPTFPNQSQALPAASTLPSRPGENLETGRFGAPGISGGTTPSLDVALGEFAPRNQTTLPTQDRLRLQNQVDNRGRGMGPGRRAPGPQVWSDQGANQTMMNALVSPVTGGEAITPVNYSQMNPVRGGASLFGETGDLISGLFGFDTDLGGASARAVDSINTGTPWLDNALKDTADIVTTAGEASAMGGALQTLGQRARLGLSKIPKAPFGPGNQASIGRNIAQAWKGKGTQALGGSAASRLLSKPLTSALGRAFSYYAIWDAGSMLQDSIVNYGMPELIGSDVDSKGGIRTEDIRAKIMSGMGGDIDLRSAMKGQDYANMLGIKDARGIRANPILAPIDADGNVIGDPSNTDMQLTKSQRNSIKDYQWRMFPGLPNTLTPEGRQVLFQLGKMTGAFKPGTRDYKLVEGLVQKTDQLRENALTTMRQHAGTLSKYATNPQSQARAFEEIKKSFGNQVSDKGLRSTLNHMYSAGLQTQLSAERSKSADLQTKFKNATPGSPEAQAISGEISQQNRWVDHLEKLPATKYIPPITGIPMSEITGDSSSIGRLIYGGDGKFNFAMSNDELTNSEAGSRHYVKALKQGDPNYPPELNNSLKQAYGRLQQLGKELNYPTRPRPNHPETGRPEAAADILDQNSGFTDQNGQNYTYSELQNKLLKHAKQFAGTEAITQATRAVQEGRLEDPTGGKLSRLRGGATAGSHFSPNMIKLNDPRLQPESNISHKDLMAGATPAPELHYVKGPDGSQRATPESMAKYEKWRKETTPGPTTVNTSKTNVLKSQGGGPTSVNVNRVRSGTPEDYGFGRGKVTVNTNLRTGDTTAVGTSTSPGGMLATPLRDVKNVFNPAGTGPDGELGTGRRTYRRDADPNVGETVSTATTLSRPDSGQAPSWRGNKPRAKMGNEQFTQLDWRNDPVSNYWSKQTGKAFIGNALYDDKGQAIDFSNASAKDVGRWEKQFNWAHTDGGGTQNLDSMRYRLWRANKGEYRDSAGKWYEHGDGGAVGMGLLIRNVRNRVVGDMKSNRIPGGNAFLKSNPWWTHKAPIQSQDSTPWIAPANNVAAPKNKLKPIDGPKNWSNMNDAVKRSTKPTPTAKPLPKPGDQSSVTKPKPQTLQTASASPFKPTAKLELPKPTAEIKPPSPAPTTTAGVSTGPKAPQIPGAKALKIPNINPVNLTARA